MIIVMEPAAQAACIAFKCNLELSSIMKLKTKTAVTVANILMMLITLLILSICFFKNNQFG